MRPRFDRMRMADAAGVRIEVVAPRWWRVDRWWVWLRAKGRIEFCVRDERGDAKRYVFRVRGVSR